MCFSGPCRTGTDGPESLAGKRVLKKKIDCHYGQANTTFAHIKGPVTQRPADAWITTAAFHFISVLFCCAACLEVSSALEESPILHRGSQARRVNTTTTLLVARARTQTCSRVQSICWRRHVRPSPALLSFSPFVCMHAFC